MAYLKVFGPKCTLGHKAELRRFSIIHCCDGARPSNSTEVSLSFCVVQDFVIVSCGARAVAKQQKKS